MALQIGVDTGGTFTDVCLFDGDAARLTVVKVSSTPQDPGRAVLDGVRAVLRAHFGEGDARQQIAEVDYFAHGTTVATNALLQERGARVGLITTQGLRDLLELCRQRRPKLYDLAARKPRPLVDRDLRLEIAERVSYRGEVEIAADLDDIRRQARSLREAGVEAVAVCLLYSFLRPEHELLVGEVLADELPDAFVSLSHRVMPEFREYERVSTTVINAFIGPIMRGYLGRLRESLADEGLRTLPKVTQSNGGVISFPQAEELPVRTVLSGPSTGVVGAAELARLSGFPDIVTFDVGGTSSDLALVTGSRPAVTNGTSLDGRPVHAPMLDISTIGAGGGSIAWVDSGGHLKVGPASAGAEPGPACYGLGNDEPTVTDANVVLGILNQERLLGGSMPIDASRSFAAVDALGRRLGLSTIDTAQGIISVVTANMAKAIRLVSVQRGYNPADYVLVPFGGAGPLHCSRLALELGMTQVLIPPTPGALSALGMLMTDLRSDYTRTRRLQLVPENAAAIEQTYHELAAETEQWFAAEGVPAAGRQTRRVADVRYLGQNYEIGVDAPAGAVDQAWLAEVVEAFHGAHERIYGYRNPGAALELVTFRVEAAADIARVSARPLASSGREVSAAVVDARKIHLPEAGGREEVPVYDRSLLEPGHVVDGPAVIEQYDTTTFLLPGQRARVDSFGMIVAEWSTPVITIGDEAL